MLLFLKRMPWVLLASSAGTSWSTKRCGPPGEVAGKLGAESEDDDPERVGAVPPARLPYALHRRGRDRLERLPLDDLDQVVGRELRESGRLRMRVLEHQRAAIRLIGDAEVGAVHIDRVVVRPVKEALANGRDSRASGELDEVGETRRVPPAARWASELAALDRDVTARLCHDAEAVQEPETQPDNVTPELSSTSAPG